MSSQFHLNHRKKHSSVLLRLVEVCHSNQFILLMCYEENKSKTNEGQAAKENFTVYYWQRPGNMLPQLRVTINNNNNNNTNNRFTGLLCIALVLTNKMEILEILYIKLNCTILVLFTFFH